MEEPPPLAPPQGPGPSPALPPEQEPAIPLPAPPSLVPEPEPPPSGTPLDRELLKEPRPSLGLLLLRLKGRRNASDDYSDALLELEDWRTWLVDKPKELSGLSQAEVLEKLRLWHRPFDYYLATDPQSSYPLAEDPEKPAAITLPEAREVLAELLRGQQRQVREQLAKLGIERIEAEEGSSLIAGVVEKSPLESVPTDERDQHFRVARLEPGSGGYRAGGRVFLVAHAICYEYAGPEP